ncbi:TOX high mobility group box family member 3-like [Osmia bicornis bicornis]|uniref:TOX high mobility group box family member 3-like n=1 Tax=Osmia bicornis bicornis TaxID=1437191 RepID=UPI001EAF0CF9|nr:TOX high mobility group box family member 3-like [Osmia bicornis bicornis]
MGESDNNYQQMFRDIQLLLQQQQEQHHREMQLQQQQQLREELLPQQQEDLRPREEPLPQVQEMESGNEEAKPPRKRGVAAGRSRRLTGYRGGQACQLGIVYVADVARVHRERAANRRNLDELWVERVRRHCQNIDVFDLRYLFGSEIDPDW